VRSASQRPELMPVSFLTPEQQRCIAAPGLLAQVIVSKSPTHVWLDRCYWAASN
jgi:hypothetical protein